uniref:Uncharacterized protein n=1 Tax=Romanomermis culicivorax TaxID=13658 RepID=A0A915JQX6_ROMCU
MDLVEDLTLTFEMPEKGLSETPKKGPSESVTLAKKVLSTIHTCDISFWIYFDNFGKERSDYFLSKYDRYKLVEQAARLHASIFENMPDTYGNILRNSRLPAVSYRRGAVSLCLPKKDTSNEYIMFNVPWKKTAIYHFLLTHGRNDLVIYTMANKYREFKPVKLTLQNILHDIKEDLSIKKDVSFITDYLEVIGQFFKMQGIRTKEHLEAFFLGLLIAVDDALTRACVGAEKNNAFPIELIFFLDDECELFFTFKNDAKSSPPSEKNGGNLLMSELQTNLEALIANAKKLSVVNSNLGAYFAGIISHFGDWRYVNSNAISFQVHRNYSILFAFGPEISCTMLSSQCKDSTYSMAIGYNMESDQMSILGLVLENLRSTMDNPSKISVCSAIKEEKYSKEEVAKESIIENNTKVTIEPEKIDEKLNDYRKEEIAKESIMENNGKVTMELEKIDEKLNDYDEEPRQCTDADFE